MKKWKPTHLTDGYFEERAIQRGWWCPNCDDLMPNKTGHCCSCPEPYPMVRDITDKWVPAYTVPVRRGK